MTVLIIADHDNIELKAGTLSAISAGLKLGTIVDVLIAGKDTAALVKKTATIAGIHRVLNADDTQLSHGLAEPLAALIVNLAQNYTHIFFVSSSAGKNTAPRVAGLLNVAQISDVVSVESPNTFKRPIYAGNAIVTVRSTDAIIIATIRPTSFEPALFGNNQANIDTIAIPAQICPTKFVSRIVSSSDRPDLNTAKIVVSGGRGLGSKENFDTLITPLAEKLNAALGASRAAVDAGYAPNEWQVGQTGKVIAPDLYIAIGISGAIQHLAGMKDAKTIVAINKDGEAPIFGVATYGLVADLFDALPKMTTGL